MKCLGLEKTAMTCLSKTTH